MYRVVGVKRLLRVSRVKIVNRTIPAPNALCTSSRIFSLSCDESRNYDDNDGDGESLLLLLLLSLFTEAPKAAGITLPSLVFGVAIIRNSGSLLCVS